METQETPMIPIDKIVVEEGLNARKSMDKEALKRLGGSIARHELVQPITVRPIEGGGYSLIAGHRRLEAAKLENIKELPAHISTSGNPRTISFIENLQREGLNKIEEAEGLEALKKELKLKNKGLAEEVGKSQGWVSGRLRLLKLPEKVQQAIAQDLVPIDAAPLLKKATDASPRIAECLCEVFQEDPDEMFSDFVGDFSEMLRAVADGNFEDPPTMIDPSRVRFSEVFDESSEREKYAARYKAAVFYAPGPQNDPILPLGEAEMTAARAGRVLLEHEEESGEFHYTTSFIVDKQWAKDLVVSAVERAEKSKKRREREEKKRLAESETGSSPGESAGDSSEAEEREKAREAARKEAEEIRAAAAAYNDRLGHALLKIRTPENRKKFGLARRKAAAIALLKRDRSLAAAGLRLVLPQLQQTQTQADGEERKAAVPSYATTTQAMEFLIGKIEAAKSGAEIDEWISMAQIAAILADEDAVKSGEETYRHDSAEEEIKEMLAEEIKTLKVRRSPKQRSFETATF